MAQDFGNGVSRTLSALQRQFQLVVWQAGKPPLDSELNLSQQAELERLANVVRAEMPSGWLIDPFDSDRDFVTNENWSNWFKVGRPISGDTQPVLWANVNGWVVPVTGTGVSDGDSSNRVNLYPAPSTDSRVDFVFLEVWQAQLAPNPSTLNKPAANELYKWGNTEFGGTNVSDDMEDPTIGFQTTQRVQLQYRLRVMGAGTGLGDSVDLSTFPDGLDDPNVLAQGAASAPLTGFIWENMGNNLGDPGLWRSGNGDASNSLNTVDGYSYAIPLCGVFRRNTSEFVARTAAGNATQNGSLDRNPYSVAISNPVEGTRTFGNVTLTAAIDEDDVGAVQVDGLSGSGLDNPDLNWDNVFLKLDDEVIYIESVSTASTPGTITIRATNGRGRNGTQAVPHDAGAKLEFYIFRPDGKTADMIVPEDILDLRKAVAPGEWDYQALLAHNLGKLFENTLQTSYKQASGSDTQGPTVVSVDTLWANGGSAAPNQTQALDGPDGIRTIFSDAATVEDASVIMIPATSSGAPPVAVADYTAGAASWPAAEFLPSGYQGRGDGWGDRSVIYLNIGGADTNGGARGTVRTAADNRFVRFVTPREYWLTRDDVSQSNHHGTQTPFQLRFLGQPWGAPAAGTEPVTDHPGPMYPLPDSNFETPYIVLGGVLNGDLRDTTTADAIAAGSSPAGFSAIRFPGVNFDAAGQWYSGTPGGLGLEGVANLLLHDTRNLYDMLTNGGADPTGASSEVYVVLGGSTVAANTGVFRVIGAGTVGYTTVSVDGGVADPEECIVVERVGQGAATLSAETGISAELRSQYTHTEDGSNAALGPSLAIVLTDLSSVASATASPWDTLVAQPIVGQAVLDTKVLYGPSRGGISRVPDAVDSVALVAAASGTELVREAPTALDPNFDNEAGVPAGEYYFPSNYIQTWNRLSSQGLAAPYAPAYGDGKYLKEDLRECEIFEDRASKTLIIRPLQRKGIALYRNQISAGTLIPTTYTAGAPSGNNVDAGSLFVASHDYGYQVPWEFMPRFGRQDIPYHQTTGTTGPVYVGINHLFGDSQTDADDVFRVVGGVSNNAAVESLFIQTGATSGRDYGEYYAMGGSSYGYQGRIYEDVSSYSSDLPHRGLKGIQLPPFLGIARVYGVYDLREFSPGGQGAYNSDRVTLSAVAGLPKNLLRTDVDKQTMYIVKDGAEDVLPGADAHTYVVPEDAIDIRLSGAYNSGDTFDSMEFVVECVVFGFASGFINKNNYVLARRELPDGSNPLAIDALAGTVSAILPLPLPYNNQVYTVSSHTVYQGDPYMTRNGSTKVTSDYMIRYGQVQQQNAFGLENSIQQYDSTNDFSQVPEIPNPRALEVLASMDFYTTLGTGKISGPVQGGAYTDVGHINNSKVAVSRIPASSSDPIWQSETRTFTQGTSSNEPLATLTLIFTSDTATHAGEKVTFTREGKTKSLVINTDWTGGSNLLSAYGFADAVNTDPEILDVFGVTALWDGDVHVVLRSNFPGEAGKATVVTTEPIAGTSRTAQAFKIVLSDSVRREASPWLPASGTAVIDKSPLVLYGKDAPMNARYGLGTTPIRMGGLTERLPLGILLQDSDFLGEDPLRNGASALVVNNSGGSASVNSLSPILGSTEYGRIQGGGIIGMADGGIQLYSPWAITNPTGTKLFRLFRGGGSAYVLDPSPEGGPVDFSAGGLDESAQPVLKGAALAGRAYLVRNYPEEAFASPERRSWGGEIQMVVVTEGHIGSGPLCEDGYAMDGQISPTGYGKGFAAADRYRLEGKPLTSAHGPAAPNPDVSGSLAPYPSEDPAEDPCP